MRQRAHLLLTQSPGVNNEYLACSNPPILLHRTPHLTQAGESPDNRGLSRFVPVVVAVSEEENRQTAIHVVCRRSGCVRDSGLPGAPRRVFFSDLTREPLQYLIRSHF